MHTAAGSSREHDIERKPKEPPAPKRGRPELPQELRKDHMIRARVTAEEAAKYERLGGAEWLRAQLKKAKDWLQPKDKTK